MQYTHEHLVIQKTLRRFIDEEINPHVDEWEAAESFPAHEVFGKLGALGLLGLNKPEAFILAIVEFLDDGSHRVHYVREPFRREPDFGVTRVNYDMAELLSKAHAPL